MATLFKTNGEMITHIEIPEEIGDKLNKLRDLIGGTLEEYAGNNEYALLGLDDAYGQPLNPFFEQHGFHGNILKVSIPSEFE